MPAQVEAEVVYEQLNGDYRSLNGFLWQIPVLVTTLTGGLWVAAANRGLTDLARSRLLEFAGVADLLVIVALFRLRSVLVGIQRRIRAMNQGAPSRVNYVVVLVTSALLAMAGVGSLAAENRPERYFGQQPLAAVHG